jgi:hypothetical protein
VAGPHAAVHASRFLVILKSWAQRRIRNFRPQRQKTDPSVVPPSG